MIRKSVTVRDLVLGSGMPKICVPLVCTDRTQLERQLSGLKNAAFDMVEFRADFYNSALPEKQQNQEDAGEMEQVLHRIREAIQETPLLFTFRTKAEGGAREISQEAYRTLLIDAAETGLIDLADLEYVFTGRRRGELIAALQGRGVVTVGSFHDFEKTPSVEEMTGLLCRMQEAGTDITKLAVMPRSGLDVVRLLEASVRMREQYADRPFITMSMGDEGMISRIAGSFTGSCITFASAGKASAPGQIDSVRLRELLSQQADMLSGI